ncbi:uncharacterized protein [Cherax quadricarinatus]
MCFNLNPTSSSLNPTSSSLNLNLIHRSPNLSPCLSMSDSSSASSDSNLYLWSFSSSSSSSSSSNSSNSSPLFFYSSSLSTSSSSSSISSSSSSSSQTSEKSSFTSSHSSKSEDSDVNNNLPDPSTVPPYCTMEASAPPYHTPTSAPPYHTPASPTPPYHTPASPAPPYHTPTSPTPPYHTSASPAPPYHTSESAPPSYPSSPPAYSARHKSPTSLSRSSTVASDLSVCSSTSALSFGSSYYLLYVVDPIGRVPTPEELPSSPEASPSPPKLSRCNSNASVSSVDTMRTVTPDQQYFDINNAAFRHMHGISRSTSYESCLTWRSRSRSLSYDSSSTLQLQSHNKNPTALHFTLSPVAPSPPATPSPTTRSQPASPVLPRVIPPSRAYSLESMTSFLRQIPRVSSSFESISTFELAPSSCSTSPLPRGEQHPDRPSSTDSPILLESQNRNLHGSQDSVMVYRPVPRYSNTDPGSPEPQSALLCYLGPARPYEPPVIYADVARKVNVEFDGLVSTCAHLLSPEEQGHMEELRAYVVEDEGSWALGENFSILFSRVLHDPSIPDQARLHLVRIMAAAALKDDVILLLHQDRRDHTIMNYANKVESLPPEHQESLALFFCNMFEHLSPSEWLLYISEWQDGGQQASNIRVTTKVAVNALLHSNAKVQEYGSAIMYNLGTKEVKTVVFDDVAPELAMAILQFFNNHPPEELLWRTMTALCRFCYSSTEVPALIKMIGPEPGTFKGASERVDAVIEEIDAKLSRVRLF